jgi:hypothetical protein
MYQLMLCFRCLATLLKKYLKIGVFLAEFNVFYSAQRSFKQTTKISNKPNRQQMALYPSPYQSK